MVGPAFVVCTSACASTAVVTIAFVAVPLLFDESGSAVVEVEETVLVIVPLADGAVTVTVRLVLWVLVNSAKFVQRTWPFVKKPELLALTNVTFVGN